LHRCRRALRKALSPPTYIKKDWISLQGILVVTDLFEDD